MQKFQYSIKLDKDAQSSVHIDINLLDAEYACSSSSFKTKAVNYIVYFFRNYVVL